VQLVCHPSEETFRKKIVLSVLPHFYEDSLSLLEFVL